MAYATILNNSTYRFIYCVSCNIDNESNAQMMYRQSSPVAVVAA